jgi:hypothetical protein
MAKTCLYIKVWVRRNLKSIVQKKHSLICNSQKRMGRNSGKNISSLDMMWWLIQEQWDKRWLLRETRLFHKAVVWHWGRVTLKWLSQTKEERISLLMRLSMHSKCLLLIWVIMDKKIANNRNTFVTWSWNCDKLISIWAMINYHTYQVIRVRLLNMILKITSKMLKEYVLNYKRVISQ